MSNVMRASGRGTWNSTIDRNALLEAITQLEIAKSYVDHATWALQKASRLLSPSLTDSELNTLASRVNAHALSPSARLHALRKKSAGK